MQNDFFRPCASVHLFDGDGKFHENKLRRIVNLKMENEKLEFMIETKGKVFEKT